MVKLVGSELTSPAFIWTFSKMHIHHLTPIQCKCPRACLPTRLRIDSPPHDDHLPDNDGKCLGPVTSGVLQHPERDDVRVEVPLSRAGQEMHRSVGASWDRHRWHTSFLSQIYGFNFYLWEAKDLAVFWAFKIIFILFFTSNLIFVVVLWEYMAARFIHQFSWNLVWKIRKSRKISLWPRYQCFLSLKFWEICCRAKFASWEMRNSKRIFCRNLVFHYFSQCTNTGGPKKCKAWSSATVLNWNQNFILNSQRNLPPCFWCPSLWRAQTAVIKRWKQSNQVEFIQTICRCCMS